MPHTRRRSSRPRRALPGARRRVRSSVPCARRSRGVRSGRTPLAPGRAADSPRTTGTSWAVPHCEAPPGHFSAGIAAAPRRDQRGCPGAHLRACSSAARSASALGSDGSGGSAARRQPDVVAPARVGAHVGGGGSANSRAEALSSGEVRGQRAAEVLPYASPFAAARARRAGVPEQRLDVPQRARDDPALERTAGRARDRSACADRAAGPRRRGAGFRRVPGRGLRLATQLRERRQLSSRSMMARCRGAARRAT